MAMIVGALLMAAVIANWTGSMAVGMLVTALLISGAALVNMGYADELVIRLRDKYRNG